MPTSTGMSDVQAYMTHIAIMHFVFLPIVTPRSVKSITILRLHTSMSITCILRNVEGPTRHGGNKDESNMQSPVPVVKVHAMDPSHGP